MTDTPSSFHDAAQPQAGDPRSAPQRIEDEFARRVLRIALPIDAAAVALYTLLFALRELWPQVCVVAWQFAPIAWAVALARAKRYTRALQFVMWPSWLVNAVLAAAEGGIGGTSAWWLLVQPVVLIQAGAMRSGAAMAGLTLAVLGTCFGLREAGAMPVLVPEPPLGPSQVLLAVAGSIALVATAVWMGVRWRRELLQELDALRASAEEATRVKSRFIANISHEIRTPLNGIVGAAELLRLSTLDAGQAHAAQIVDHSAQALLAVVNDVLDFSKLEAGRVEIERIALDPAALVYDTAETFGGQAHARGVELWAHAAADVPVQIHSDLVRLRQILHNLASNALKFTESGEIRIELTVRPASASDPVAQLRFAVRDTGIGLDVAQQARLFRAFTQADISTTRRFGGTGLGLVICRELTQLMGGRLELDSAPGAGSTFALLLPLAARAPAFAPDDAPPPARVRPPLLICTPSTALRDDLLDWALRAGNAAQATATGTPDDWVARALAAGADAVVMDDEALRACGLSRGSWAARLEQHGLAGVLLVGVSVPVGAVPASLVPLYKPTRPLRLDAAVREARRMRPQPAVGAAAVAAEDARPAPEARADDDIAARGPRVLLVEDNAVNQAVATALLAQLGVASAVAADGSVALEMLEAEADAFAFVLMDCQMPVLDGFAATRAWRERERRDGRARLPVIAMTANSVAEAGAACTAAGMDDFIAKPFTLRDLEAVLQRWLPGRST